jgi:hypothetical protein
MGAVVLWRFSVEIQWLGHQGAWRYCQGRLFLVRQDWWRSVLGRLTLGLVRRPLFAAAILVCHTRRVDSSPKVAMQLQLAAPWNCERGMAAIPGAVLVLQHLVAVAFVWTLQRTLLGSAVEK